MDCSNPMATQKSLLNLVDNKTKRYQSVKRIDRDGREITGWGCECIIYKYEIAKGQT